MRIRSLSLLGIVAAWLLIDLWRLWTPSLITLFGRAAETPPEIMGAYALGVMAAPLVLLAFVRRSAPVLAAWLLAAAFVVRMLLRMNPGGGDAQLYGSSLGVALSVAALCLLAGALGRTLVPSVFVGLALSASVHAMLGSFGSVWREDAADVGILLVQAVLVAVAVCGAGGASRTPIAPRTALLLLPSVLILLLGLSNVGRGSTLDPVWGPLAVVAGAWAAAAVALLPSPPRRPWIAGLLFVASVAVAVPLEVSWGGTEGMLSAWAALGFVVGPAALARLLLFAGDGTSARRAALAAGGGAVVWTLLFFAFYAGYDLGYRADLVVVGAAVAVVAWTLAYRSGGAADEDDARAAAAARMDDSGGRAVAAVAVVGVVAMATAFVGPALTIPTRPIAAAAEDELTVVAFNVRMGYGIDGTFDPAAVAEQIRDAGAHVVLLSEVDRGWLLNGGQDELAILARMLGMRFVFGPAADQVWGDAILTDLEVTDARTRRYPQFDALTGASLTEATVLWDGRPIRVISTHLQPDGNDLNATGRQAEVLAGALSAAASEGPVIGGGDLNTTPGSDAWRTLEASGAKDALASIRPAPTSPADGPDEEIDHLFVAGLDVASAEVVASSLSDHLMVVARFRP